MNGRTVLESFPAGGPRGSWPAEEFAQARRSEGLPASSLDWGYWQQRSALTERLGEGLDRTPGVRENQPLLAAVHTREHGGCIVEVPNVVDR